MKIDRPSGYAIIASARGYSLAKFDNAWRVSFQIIDREGNVVESFDCESYDNSYDFYSMQHDGHDYDIVHVIHVADRLDQILDLEHLSKTQPLPDFTKLDAGAARALAHYADDLAKGRVDFEDYQYDRTLVSNFGCFYREFLVTGSLAEAQEMIVGSVPSEAVLAITETEIARCPVYVPVQQKQDKSFWQVVRNLFNVRKGV